MLAIHLLPLKHALNDSNSIYFSVRIDQNNPSHFSNTSMLIESLHNCLLSICDSSFFINLWLIWFLIKFRHRTHFLHSTLTTNQSMARCFCSTWRSHSIARQSLIVISAYAQLLSAEIIKNLLASTQKHWRNVLPLRSGWIWRHIWPQNY